MSLKKSLLLGMLLNTSIAHASVVIYHTATEPFCDTIHGRWTGNATVVISGFPNPCLYRTDTDINGQDTAHLDVHLKIQKKHGPAFCPVSKQFNLRGHCDLNKLVIETDDQSANFSGELIDATTATLSGKLIYSGKTASINKMTMKKMG